MICDLILQWRPKRKAMAETKMAAEIGAETPVAAAVGTGAGADASAREAAEAAEARKQTARSAMRRTEKALESTAAIVEVSSERKRDWV